LDPIPEGTLTVTTQTEDASHDIRNVWAKDSKTPYIRTFKLREEEIFLILETLNFSDAFSIHSEPRGGPEACLDPTNYVAEFAEATRYNWAVLACDYKPNPKDGTLWQLGSLLELLARSYVGADLNDFPGN